MKKKAYILAFQRATNYGAVLQIYALKTTLEKFGLDVEVIDYIPEWMKVTFKNQPTVKSYIKRKVMNFTFKSFFQELGLTKRTFYDNNSLKKYLQDGKFYFVGSDQVWNEKIMKKDPTYFLDFVPKNVKKIGYAVSMGNNNLSDEFKDKVNPLIGEFSSLSGREVFVSSFVKTDHSNMNVPIVLDPTLLLEANDYEKVRNHKKFDSKYIALYAAMHDENLYNYAKHLSNITGLPIVNLGYHYKGADKQEYLLGPGNWLDRIYESAYFITNSFHGTVFSIIYQKDFFVVPNQNPLQEGLNARFEELLKSLELDDRLVYSSADIKTVKDKKIDYVKAYKLLETRKEKSIRFIREVIK